MIIWYLSFETEWTKFFEYFRSIVIYKLLLSYNKQIEFLANENIKNIHFSSRNGFNLFYHHLVKYKVEFCVWHD